MYPFKTIRTRSGFTLIEILIALLLVGILLTTLFAASRGLLHQIQPVTRQTRMGQLAAAALNRFQVDLSQVVISMPPAYRRPQFNTDPDPYRIVGQNDTALGKTLAQLQFASLGHFPETTGPQEGVARIVYYVSETQSGEKVLRRSDRLFPYGEFEPQPGDPVLCRHVDEFAIFFSGADGEEVESWDSESKSSRFSTPPAMRIVLTLKEDDRTWRYESYHQLATVRKAAQ